LDLGNAIINEYNIKKKITIALMEAVSFYRRNKVKDIVHSRKQLLKKLKMPA